MDFSFVWTIISFIIIFTVIVVSHEFGHYLVGRLNGIGVREFTIGFGPAIFKKQGKYTTFAIRLLPLGGACIFDGMFEDDENSQIEELDGDSEDGETEKIDAVKKVASEKDLDGVIRDENHRPFNEAPVWGRIATIVAGPFFNIVLAYLLALFVCWFAGSDTPVLADVMEGYPAAEAGIQGGDEIVSINGQRIYVWREISVVSMLNYGEELSIVYRRDGQEYEALVTPKFSEEDNRYFIGFMGGGTFVECNNLSVFKYSAIEVRYWLITTYRSLIYMFSGHASADDLAGPVGVATVIDDTIEETSQYGVFTVILNMVNIALLLSVNLGVVNLVPFPAIDGGRLILLLFEAISGKKIPPDKEGIIHLIGFVLLALLMIFVFYNDFMRLFRR